jgi:Flp pilus assembly protein TadD
MLTWRQCGMYEGPETLWEATLQRNPGSWMAHDNLGGVLVHEGREEEAVEHWRKALKLKPDDAFTYYNLGMAASQEGRVADAMAFYQQALDLDPDQVETDNKLAWILATSPLPALRNGPRAVALAQHANQLARGRNTGVLGTLAAALAEAGRFPEAVATVRQALPLAAARNETTMVEDLRVQLSFYQTNALFRDLSLTNNSLAH